MAGDDVIAFASAAGLTELYRKRVLSPVEAARLLFDRLEALEPKLNAFSIVDRDGAFAAAGTSEERWRRGEPLGPLDGVPVTIKDLMLMRGFPTLRGSHLVDPNQDWSEDTPAVARLREAGAVILGKTATSEFGWKALGDSPLHGITRNPWDPSRSSGGSSRHRDSASRQRRRRLDSHPIQLLRRFRAEAEFWPGAGLSPFAARAVVASRADCPDRR